MNMFRRFITTAKKITTTTAFACRVLSRHYRFGGKQQALGGEYAGDPQ